MQANTHSQPSVRWHAAWQQGGVEALRSRGPTGPDPKVSAAQLAKVEQALLQGAQANGFDTDLESSYRWQAVTRRWSGSVWLIFLSTANTSRAT